MAIRKAQTTVGNKRDITAVQSKVHPGLYELKFVGGGEVPDIWKGHLFTNMTEAKKYVDAYLQARS